MEKIFILGSSDILKNLGDNFIPIPNISNDKDIHDWIKNLFSNHSIEKLVIEIESKANLSLKIGYHIRLSIEELREKTLIPILYVSSLSLNSIIINTQLNTQILSTKGIYFSEFEEVSIIKAELDLIEGLTDSNYLTGFLKLIQIQPDETIGRHSLANIWGAYAMDKATNANALPIDADFKKTLYFKYVSAFNNIHKLKPSPLKVLGNISVGNVNTIDSEEKKILLIDDEADKGWETVLRKVFKTSKSEDFTVINEKVKDYEELSDKSKKIIENQSFDLYLVDLRLSGLEEEDILETKNFSGMKILQKIKSLNQGNQVIIFTASNKVWNLKALLDKGADGYYLKESPEYNFSNKFSEQNYKNFKQDIEKCFEKGYLKEIYEEWKLAKNEISNSDNRFIQESNSMLEIAWNLINQEQLDFTYLTLFQIVELYANKKYDHNDNSIMLNGIRTNMIELDGDKEKWKLTFNKDKRNGDFFSSTEEEKNKGIQANNLFKASCILKLIYGKDDSFLQDFGKLNDLRHKIAHKGKANISPKQIKEILEIIKLIRA